MAEFGCFLLSLLRRETPMKTILALAATAAILGGALMMPNTADAKGCLKGAAVGGVAGHMVGSGHGTAGAATGCAVGHHEANKKEDKKQQEQDSQQHANSQNGDTANQTKQ
jgi:uncharacterized protein YcfJ